MVERHGIAYHEKTLGQLFCDGSARQIIDMLLGEMKRHGAELRLATARASGSTGRTHGFVVALAEGTVACSSLVVACGGKSIPKMGASGFGYEIARPSSACASSRPARHSCR